MNMPKPNIRIEWVLVTPELAAQWLKRNHNNRGLRDRVVTKYARDMQAGDWADAGDPIRMASDGTLLDGQHRLAAIIKANIAIWMPVAEGVDRSAQSVMDTGAARIYADQLKIQGYRNNTILAAALRWLVLWERGDRMTHNATPPTHSEMEAALSAHPELHDSAEFARAATRQLRIASSVFAMGHWLFCDIDKSEALWFLCRVADGTELTADHPAYAFRERIRRDRENNRNLRGPVQLALLIIAWNAHRDQRPLTKLQLPKAGLVNGNYPVPK